MSTPLSLSLPPPSSPALLKPTSSQPPTPHLASIPNTKSFRGFHRRARVLCSSGGGRTPGPSPDENESKAILDAFFLGKAFTETLNERIGSAIGEILSLVGQWQAEQQKQVQDFQEEVIERAKKAKEKAALEVKEEQGVLSKPLRGPSDDGNVVVTPMSQGADDPFQEMLKD